MQTKREVQVINLPGDFRANAETEAALDRIEAKDRARQAERERLETDDREAELRVKGCPGMNPWDDRELEPDPELASEFTRPIDD